MGRHEQQFTVVLTFTAIGSTNDIVSVQSEVMTIISLNMSSARQKPLPCVSNQSGISRCGLLSHCE